MSKEDLALTLDYILNRSNERDIEVIAAAVIRRRRDMSMGIHMPVAPDPRRMAEEIQAQLNLEGNIEGLKKTVRDYAIRIIKQEAPELTDKQVDELTRAWVPGERGSPRDRASPGRKKTKGSKVPEESTIPPDLLGSMIEQFVSFSQGEMTEQEDQSLRREMGSWPEKYWKAFPEVIRLLITDYIKEEISLTEFKTRLDLSLNIR